MSDPDVDEAETRRVAKFFVDLLATLTTDDVGEEEAMALLRSVWATGQREGLVTTPEGAPVDEQVLTAGFVRIAVSLAHMVVAERRATGRSDVTAVDVWCDLREFMASLEDR